MKCQGEGWHSGVISSDSEGIALSQRHAALRKSGLSDLVVTQEVMRRPVGKFATMDMLHAPWWYSYSLQPHPSSLLTPLCDARFQTDANRIREPVTLGSTSAMRLDPSDATGSKGHTMHGAP